MGVVFGKVLEKSQVKNGQTRRYRRVRIQAPIRLVVNGIDEYQGELINISAGDLAMRTDAHVVVGDAATAYVENIDVIEGCVARTFPDGLALSFRLSQSRRTLLTERLMVRANQAIASDLADRRSGPRHRTGAQSVTCRLADGGSLFVRIIDKSVDGVAVEAHRKPPVGATIHIGRMSAVILRHTPRGFVAVYDHGRPHSGAGMPERHLKAV